MMAGDGVPSGFVAVFARCGGGRALHYILQRSIVLHEIEIRSCDGAKGYTKIANNRDCFQENLGKHDGGSPVHIYTAGMHCFHQGGEEAKVMERGHSKSGAVGGGMHVRDVRSDR